MGNSWTPSQMATLRQISQVINNLNSVSATAVAAHTTATAAQTSVDAAQTTLVQNASDTIALRNQSRQIVEDDVFHSSIVSEFVCQEAFTALSNIGSLKIPKIAILSNVTWNLDYTNIFKDPLAQDPATAETMFNMYFKAQGDDPVFTGFDYADGISVHYIQDTTKGTKGSLRIQMHRHAVNANGEAFMDWKNSSYVIAQFYGMRYGKTKKKQTDGETGSHFTSIVGWACSKYPFFLNYQI